MSATAARLGARVLRSPNLTQTGQLYRQGDGSRNEYGEWESAGFTEHDVRYATAPTSGSTREILPEGLREKDLRSFWLTAATKAVSETTEGDVISHNGRYYRVAMMLNWDGFREVVTTYPFVGELGIIRTLGGFSAGFSAGFDVVREVAA